MNNQEINKTQGKKANTMHSLKMKIFLLVFIAIIFAIVLCLLMIVPKSKSNLETVIENYMKRYYCCRRRKSGQGAGKRRS
ncbi:MAG: hypothetical protein ACLSHX_07140 [Suilimivivens sp.]